MKIEERIDIGGLTKKLKMTSTNTLLSAFATLSPKQLRMLQMLINTALRTVAEQKLREEIREEIIRTS